MAKDEIKAHHEAGHAVIARVLGVGVTGVMLFSTRSDNSSAAETVSAAYAARDADLPSRVAALEADAKVALAGPQAQLKYQLVKKRRRDEWEGDITNAQNAACQIVLLMEGATLDPRPHEITLTRDQGNEVNRIVDRLLKEVEHLVIEHWPAIERVAKALLAHRCLSQADVDALIADRPWSPLLERTADPRLRL